LLAGLLLWAGRRSPFGTRGTPLPHLPRRVVAFVPFTGAVLRDVVVGTWTVILVALHLRPLVQPGIVAVPIEGRTPTGVAVSALATTLSPGTFLVDVDWEQGMMLFHVLDARDPDAVRRMQQGLYARYQRHVFP
jgi:multisubunit Na+/H+ antiporter MnhE subunit